MGLDRLDEVTIGEPCKVDGCSTVCVEGEDRCHDHSVNRMIEGLFAYVRKLLQCMGSHSKRWHVTVTRTGASSS